MRVDAMFHPIDRGQVERWALSRGYGCRMEMSMLSQGYLLAHVEASIGSNYEAVLRDMVNNGIRVMKRPGVLMTATDPSSMLSGMDRLGEVLLREDDLWRDALPGLEKMGFGIGRPDKYGPQYYAIDSRSGERATGQVYPFKPEGVLALWMEVKGKKIGYEERERVLAAFHKKQANRHPELGEVVNQFAHGTRIRGMKKRRPGEDLKLRKRARRMQDTDYLW